MHAISPSECLFLLSKVICGITVKLYSVSSIIDVQGEIIF